MVLVFLNRACYKPCAPFNIRSIACSGPREHNCCKVSAVHLSGGATPPSPAGYSWWMTRWKLLAGQAQHHAISHAANGMIVSHRTYVNSFYMCSVTHRLHCRYKQVLSTTVRRRTALLMTNTSTAGSKEWHRKVYSYRTRFGKLS